MKETMTRIRDDKEIPSLESLKSIAERIIPFQPPTPTSSSQNKDSDLELGYINAGLRKLEASISKHKTYEASNKEYLKHREVFKEIGDLLLKPYSREFQIDDSNKFVIRQLIIHANRWDEFAEKYYQGHDTRKNLLVIGKPGCGKTLLMQVLSEFVKIMGLPAPFIITSMTEVMNYQKVNSHIDYFTFNTDRNKAYQSKPFGICINDLGIDTEQQKSYGTDLSVITDELLFARYELYQRGFPYHITTNLDLNGFKKRFGCRILDRFNSFNIIHLEGESRR